jgi:hypothetical protein
MIPPEARTNAFAWLDATGATFTDNYTISSTHADVGNGYTPGNFTSAMAGNANLNADYFNYYGIRWDSSFASQVGKGADYNIYGAGRFGGKDLGGLATESYISMRQTTAPANEQRWFLDLKHLNPSGGIGQEVYSGVGAISATLVGGTSGVFKFTSYQGTNTDIKRAPALAYAGRYILQDASSAATGNVITDSTPWKYCFAYKVNECRTSSIVGEVYLTVPQADMRGISDAQCIAGWYASTSPCVWIASPSQAWGVQVDASRKPVDDNTWRKITMGFSGPGRQYQFGNMIPAPDGKWAFTQGYWLDGARNEILAMKLPPFPSYDTINRADYVPVPVEISGEQGTSARIRFGYAENGSPSSFFCTSRQEACVTDISVAPFAFAQSDALTPASCASGCTVNIPGISGRVVYYVTERMDQTGQVVQQGDMQTRMVP